MRPLLGLVVRHRYPLTAIVELRDQWGGGIVTVPYSALSPAPPGVTRLP